MTFDVDSKYSNPCEVYLLPLSLYIKAKNKWVVLNRGLSPRTLGLQIIQICLVCDLNELSRFPVTLGNNEVSNPFFYELEK